MIAVYANHALLFNYFFSTEIVLLAISLNKVRHDGHLAVGPLGAVAFSSAANVSSACHCSGVNSSDLRSSFSI